MGDFHLLSNFRASLRRIFDDVDLSIDERLEQAIAMLDRWDPTLRENAARWEDEEIAKASWISWQAPVQARERERARRDCSTPWRAWRS